MPEPLAETASPLIDVRQAPGWGRVRNGLERLAQAGLFFLVSVGIMLVPIWITSEYFWVGLLLLVMLRASYLVLSGVWNCCAVPEMTGLRLFAIPAAAALTAAFLLTGASIVALILSTLQTALRPQAPPSPWLWVAVLTSLLADSFGLIGGVALLLFLRKLALLFDRLGLARQLVAFLILGVSIAAAFGLVVLYQELSDDLDTFTPSTPAAKQPMRLLLLLSLACCAFVAIWWQSMLSQLRNAMLHAVTSVTGDAQSPASPAVPPQSTDAHETEETRIQYDRHQ